jgi:hypothetical protein
VTATTARNGHGASASELRGAREVAVAPVAQPGGRSRRRWGRVAGGAIAVVIGAWLFAALYLSAGNRVDVLAVSQPVARFETISRSDLRVVRVSADSGVATVSASELDTVVGRVASTELVAGSLLAPGQVRSRGERLLGSSEAIVGLLLGRGDAPGTQLRRGLAVSIVVRPSAGTHGDPLEVSGRVFDASAAPLSSGERPVEVVVPKAKAAVVSAAGADKRVTVVALAE